MRGGRTRETIFQETQYSANIKSWEEKRWKKVRTRFLYIQTNIVNKKCGGTNARINFSRNTRIVRAKIFGKKLGLKKLRKNVFYIHTNIVTKKWGKKRPKQFFQIHMNSTIKKRWEINRRKKCLNRV